MEIKINFLEKSKSIKNNQDLFVEEFAIMIENVSNKRQSISNQ